MTTVATNFSGGALILGDTSGNAVPAGYVGETISRYYSQTKTVSTSAYTNLEWSNGVTALNLSAGVWLIKLSVLEAAGTANAGFRAGISTDSSTTFNDLIQTENAVDVGGAQPSVNVTSVVVTTVNISSATNYYCKAQVSTATSRIYQVALKAIRIA